MKLLGFHRRRIPALIVLVTAFLMGDLSANAQLRDFLNLPDHDSKRYYLGIGFMYTNSHLQVTPHPKFLQSDSVLSVTPGNTGGFGVSGMFTLRLSEHWELRAAFPEFIFADGIQVGPEHREKALAGALQAATDLRAA